MEDLCQARSQLGTPGGRRVFLEGPKFFELCPIFSNYIQRVFPGRGKKISKGSFTPLVTGLICAVKTVRESVAKMIVV